MSYSIPMLLVYTYIYIYTYIHIMDIYIHTYAQDIVSGGIPEARRPFYRLASGGVARLTLPV